jgi:hypothetical protein
VVIPIGVAIVEVLDRSGEDIPEGVAVRWTGFRATGGGIFFEAEEVVEVESRCSARVACVRGLKVFEVDTGCCKDVWEKFLVNSITDDDAGSKGGGNRRSL